ncbi:MAG: divalent-cation tolerance protein CutA [Desulfomonilaceae bacterium]|nr:divalent-cation tolerance protein CutA [Desulfomonilaceae bacterium]
MGPYILCLVTIDDLDKAVHMARTIVEKKLAACVNILPQIRSIYSWKGETCDEAEQLMIVKTTDYLFERLQEEIKRLHPYEVPEIIAFNIDRGLPDYLRWIDDTTDTGR